MRIVLAIMVALSYGYVMAGNKNEGDRSRVNLSISREVKRLMKMQVAADEREISELTEELYIRFLKDRGAWPPESKKPSK